MIEAGVIAFLFVMLCALCAGVMYAWGDDK
jgi:hypothetical protein